MKIKQHTYSSSSDYKMSTGKQLQGLGTNPSYKLCRVIVIVGKQGTLSKKDSLGGTLSKKEDLKKKLVLKHKGQPPLNWHNSKWTVLMNSKSEQWSVQRIVKVCQSDFGVTKSLGIMENHLLSRKHRESSFQNIITRGGKQ